MRYHADSKVYTFDDETYLLSLLNESIPNSIYVEDIVWGTTYISERNFVLDFYDYISSLPVSENGDAYLEDNINGVKGAVYFTSGQSVPFELGNYVSVDGIIHGTEHTKAELKTYIILLKKALYNNENLANIITAQNKIQIRMGNDKKTLAMTQKRKLKELILAGKPLKEDAISGAIRDKGEPVCRLECYISENAASPEIYMVIYENNLCMVFDSYGNQSGSIMQMMIDEEKMYNIMQENNS